MSIDPARLPADQLGYIGVLFLRHDGAAGGIGVVQLNKLELPAAPEDDLLRKPAQVHHQDGQIAQQLNGIIPIADPVQAVGAGGVKAQELCRLPAVDRVGSSRQRSAAKRADVHSRLAVQQSCHVPFELFPVGQQVLREGNRLRPLQMGITGHHGLLMLFGLVQDGLLEVQDLLDDLVDLPAEEEAEVHGDLIVPAAGGVEALACRADPFRQKGFHVHVDVLVVGGKFDFSGLDIGQNVFQALDDLFFVLPGDDAAVRQHGRVGDAAFDIFPVHAAVKLDGGVEIVDQRVGLFAEPSAP